LADSPDLTRFVERARVRKVAMLTAFVTSLVVFAVLVLLDQGLHSPHAAHGMISFELAGPNAAAILSEWHEPQRRDALLLQGLDYLFIPAYAVLLATCALALAAGIGARAPRVARLAPVAAWTAALAGSADVIENVPLIAMLRAGAASPSGAAVAQVCATVKFALVGVVMLYLICAGVIRVIRA
jgi:hypothetical protein